MLKRVFCIGILLVMIFSLTACGKISLNYHKRKALSDLEAYAQEADYFVGDWKIISGIVATCKLSIDEAENTDEIDTAINIAKEEITEVPKKVEMDEEVIAQIIQSAWDTFFKMESLDEAAIEDVYIERYFGTFNGSIVVMVWSNGFESTRNAVEFTFGEYDFCFSGARQIWIWRSGEFYNLDEAVNKNFITIENIQIIYELWSKISIF